MITHTTLLRPDGIFRLIPFCRLPVQHFIYNDVHFYIQTIVLAILITYTSDTFRQTDFQYYSTGNGKEHFTIL